MKKTIKKLITLCLSFVLVATVFASCGEDTSEDRDSSRHKTKQEETEDKKGISNFIPGMDISSADESHEEECWVAQTFSEVTDILDIEATTFNEGYAFVRVRKEKNEFYVIDKTGSIKFPLDIGSTVMAELCFYNGLCFLDDSTISPPNVYLIDTKGNKYTAEDFGGTALGVTDIDLDMLEGGYFIVDKVTSTFDGATYETAVYNTNREQVQPYSTELYTFIHDQEYSKSFLFYNGYIIKYVGRVVDDEAQTYHIATDTYGGFRDITVKHKMDFAQYSNDAYSDQKGMCRNDEILLDLSQYETLSNVEYIGDNGIALFRNEANDYYFSVMDTEGNLKFDPIYYGKLNYCTIDFNGSVIMTKNFLNQPDGEMLVQIKTYDLNGKEMGALEMTKSASTFSFIETDFGTDTIVIKHYDNNTIGYYDMNLKPMFSAE